MDADEKIWDQNAFNDIFRRVIKVDETRSDGLFWSGRAPVRTQRCAPWGDCDMLAWHDSLPLSVFTM